MARRFGGLDGDNRIILDVGDIVSDGGPITVLFLWRPAVTWDNVLITGVASGSETWAAMALSDDRYYTAGDFGGFAGVEAEAFQIAGYCKESGSAAARWHILVEGGSWTHGDGSTIGDQGAATSIWIGNGPNDLAGIRLRGDWICAAVWDTKLSDIQVESSVSMTALQTWFDASPAALWDGDQADTSDPVVDRMGGGADQTASSNPAVVSDAPTGWSYALGSDGVTVAIAHGLALGYSVQASTSVSATVAHSLTLTHSIQASSTVDATVQHGLALDHVLQANTTGTVSVAHGLVLNHSLTVSSSIDSGLSHGLALDHAMSIVTGAVSATIQHGLVLGHQVSADAVVVTSVQHGLALDHSTAAFVGDSIAITVQHGLALTHALTAESGATLATIEHGLRLTHAMTVDVAVVVMASIEHGLVLDHSMTVDIELDALGRPIQPLADARLIQPETGVRSIQSSANARPIQPLFTGV